MPAVAPDTRRPHSPTGYERHARDEKHRFDPRLIKRRGQGKAHRTRRSRAQLQQASRKIDWTDRRGVVERVTANKAAAMVLWDGRKSADDVPIRSIEPG